MKDTKLTELPIVPHMYETEHFARLRCPDQYPRVMTIDERKFIHGLIRYYLPENILEIGVFHGCGTMNILNAISDMEARLVSIDTDTSRTDAVRQRVRAAFPPDSSQWRFLGGVDPSQVMETLDVKFDFVVIDALHIHPGESLNFLAILPWLNDGAVVVLHDTTSYVQNWCRQMCYASRLLMSAVCADKLVPDILQHFFHGEICDICAFQISADTRKYIRNVFDGLFFPWGIFQRDIVESMRQLVNRHYSREEARLFEKAVQINDRLLNIWGLDELPHDTIFYGAGAQARQLIHFLLSTERSFNFRLWDVKADEIKAIRDCPVAFPDFETRARPGQIMIVMIENAEIYEQVKSRFEPLGYTVQHRARRRYSKPVGLGTSV